MRLARYLLPLLLVLAFAWPQEALAARPAAKETFGYRPPNLARYRAAVAQDKPVGAWGLGEASGTTAIDRTATANNGTYTNASGFTLAQPGALRGALSTLFTAASQGWVSVPHNAAYNVGSVLTLEVVAKRVGAGTSQGLMGKGTGSPGLFLNASSFLVVAKVNTSTVCASNAAFTDTTSFHHLVGTFDGTNCAVYVDGALAGSGTSATALTDNSNVLAIGSSTGSSSFWNGYLAEAAIYNYALSATRVQAHYRAMLP